MRIDTIQTEVYPFAELSDEAKATAVENLYDINVSHEWYDCTYEDATAIGLLMGIDITNIYFSGFSSQGDGACFEGSYEYAKNSIKAVKEYAPKDEELHRIAETLKNLQKQCFYSVHASIRQSGHYNHRFCTDISVDFENHHTGIDYYNDDTETAIIETLRDFMHWIYKTLNKEYDYYVSEKAIIETIEANEYEFTEEGKLY